MACIIPRPDPATLFAHYRDMMSADVLGGAQVVPESNEWYVTALNYAMAEEFHAILEQQVREQDPRFACCENLYDMAAKDGVYPQAAVAAQGYVILTGVVGSALPSTIEIQVNGNTYRSVGTVPAQMSTASITLRFQAVEPGPGGNLASDVVPTTGQLTTPIVGVDTEVIVCGGRFCGGKDAETCDQFRQRYIQRKTYQPRATSAWIQQKLLEWPCATRVCERAGACCDCGEDGLACGCGEKLQYYVMFDQSFPCGIPPANVVADIQTWMFGERPGYGMGQVEVGICGSIHQPISFEVDLNVDIGGCPTPAQQQQMAAEIRDLFTTICPSVTLYSQQVEVIVANIMGPATAVQIRFTAVTPNNDQLRISPCGDLEPACDYLPCLRNLTFSGPAELMGGCP